MKIRLEEVTLIFFFTMLSGCRHTPDVPPSPLFTYTNDISAITLNNCATSGCHDGSGRKHPLLTYPDVMHYVSPGKPYSSKLFTSIVKLSGKKMPPQGPLSDQQIKTIYVWILQGAKE